MALQEDRPFKILAIDGGGIKGLFSAKVLEHLEKAYNCNLSDHFDLICGTSTGGIIALALSLKIDAKDICKFYEENGRKIFPKKIIGWKLFKQIFFRGKYSDKNLIKALKVKFKNKKIKDSNNLLCIPTYCLTNARPWIIKKNHHKLGRDDELSYVDAALATTAAPTYFPLKNIKQEYYEDLQFVDGGIFANNPSLVGLIEALRFYVGENKEFNSLMLLSVSSLNKSQEKLTGIRRFRSFIDWGADLFEATLNAQAHNIGYFMDIFSKSNIIPFHYVRITHDNLSEDQCKVANLDNSSKKALKCFADIGNTVGFKCLPKGEISDETDLLIKNISKFFKNKKTIIL